MASPLGSSRLPKLLKRVGMSQVKFAELMQIDESMVSQIITGKKSLTLINARKASILLNCTIEELYTWDSSLSDD